MNGAIDNSGADGFRELFRVIETLIGGVDPQLAGSTADLISRTPGLEASPNSQPLGATTGAPVRTRLFPVPVPSGGVMLVGADRANRTVRIVAPAVQYGIFVGFGGAPSTRGTALPPGIPFEVILPGNQQLWASTNAPVYIQVFVEVAPLLVGDRERTLRY